MGTGPVISEVLSPFLANAPRAGRFPRDAAWCRMPSRRHSPPTKRRPMIEVHHLTKRFPGPGRGEIVAVDNLSFSVATGEVYGLLGPNGAGKTTTLRMILGLLRPTSGQASIAGFGSSEFPDEVKRRVGYVSSSA